MEWDKLIDYCESLGPEIEATFPFNPTTLVYKVKGKMFVLGDIITQESINVKSDPEYSLILRGEYEGIEPGYHMNKKHWNTIKLNADVPTSLIQKLILESFHLVGGKKAK